MRVRRHPADEVGLQIAPLCDVVFLILTFFLLTTELAKRPPSVPVRLPVAPRAGSDAGDALTVEIDAAGGCSSGGRPLDGPALDALLRERAAALPGGLRVRLRANAAAPARAVKEAIARSAAAGAREITLGAVPRR